VERGLAFYERHSALTSDGKARYVRYPGSREESTGTVALVTLTLIDYLRAPAAGLAATRRAAHGEHLGQYLAFLERLQRPDGLWPDSYDARTGEPGEDSSPYSVGEATLAVVKAARYLGYERLRAAALRAADRGHLRYVVEALAEHPDSPETKGYYQWGSMAFFELATSGWPETQAYARRVIELADWMIDVHRTLERTRNTAYAFEGIIHAYRLAVEAGDRAHAEKFLCTIEQGLTKLTSWQVGGPLANDFIRSRPLRDPEAVGGVQNHCCESPLRIDTTQHQMHALILARRYVFPATAAVQSRQDAP
jgi:UDP-N-acetylmuramoyl-tripeptide--D-alanyl-D-alanine ligase